MMRMFFLFFTLLIFVNKNVNAQEVLFISNPHDEKLNEYCLAILQNGLSYSLDNNYQIKTFNYSGVKARGFMFVTQDEGTTNVIAAGATKKRFDELLAIEVPLLKGLNGWRLSLVTLQNKNIFSSELELEDFKKFIPGQISSWSDFNILRSNGIEVMGTSNYIGLFEMLKKNRFDYLPRSVLEINREYNTYGDSSITIEPNIVIHYPTAYYFYVNKQNIEFAQMITFGMEASIKDGSFDRIFYKHYGGSFEQLGQENRKIYHLENSSLPENTPLARDELWLNFN
jgi:hypothetical protein